MYDFYYLLSIKTHNSCKKNLKIDVFQIHIYVYYTVNVE